MSLFDWPRGLHDARMLSNSELYKILKESKIPKNPKVVAEEEDTVPICLLGDSAYPLVPFLIKECAVGERSKEKQFYGFKLSSARTVIECAFGRLKARWGCLRHPIDINTKDLPAPVMACFVLHNFCEINSELVPKSTFDAVKAYYEHFQPPTHVNCYRVATGEANARDVRQTFRKVFE